METKIIETNNTDGYNCFRIPGIVITVKGTILMYYECRKSESDWAQIDIGMRRSCDSGKSWSERKILAYGNGKTVNNPIMFVNGEEITLMYQEEYSRTFICKSFNDGESFSSPTEITQMLQTPDFSYYVIACGPGHGIVTKSGRYLVPVWFAENKDNKRSHTPSWISTVYSDDGINFRIGEKINTEGLVNPSETAIAEIMDGLIINIRNESDTRRRGIAYSKNGTSSWSKVSFNNDLPDPVCCAGMFFYKDNLYFTNCRNEKKRENLTIYKSEDSGRTWQPLKEISRVGGYSDVAINDGYAFILYEHWGEDYKSIELCIYKLELS